MSAPKKAAIRLYAEEASKNENGYAILDESPERETAKIVTVLDANEDLVPARAKLATEAKRILKEVWEYSSPTVALEKWIFEDRETNDQHEGEVWVMQLPQQRRLRKKRGGTSHKRLKSTRKQKKKAAKRGGAKIKRSYRRRSK
jgi:hypothetical protein